jgi:hypothetical protein
LDTDDDWMRQIVFATITVPSVQIDTWQKLMERKEEEEEQSSSPFTAGNTRRVFLLNLLIRNQLNSFELVEVLK